MARTRSARRPWANSGIASSRRTRLVAVLAVAVAALTACGTGQRAQTSVEVPVIDAVEANAGTLYLRALTVTTPKFGQYPVGSSAPVQLLIVNGGADDQLDSVTVAGNAADSVALFPSAQTASAAPAVAAPASSSAGASPTDSAAATDSASAPASDSASASASTPGSVASIDLPSGETTSIGLTPSQPVIELLGLKEVLWPAMKVQLTFTFAHAGSVQVWVSVQLSQGPVTAPTLTTGNTDVEE